MAMGQVGAAGTAVSVHACKREDLVSLWPQVSLQREPLHLRDREGLTLLEITRV